jgi:hypothetical protein
MKVYCVFHTESEIDYLEKVFSSETDAREYIAAKRKISSVERFVLGWEVEE